MKLFGRKKSCCENTSPETMSQAEAFENQAGIKILGSGCAKCRELEEHTKEAMTQLGLHEPVEHVTDFARIAAYGVMTTPALVIDGSVVSYGKVLKTDEVNILLEKARHLS